MSHMTKVHSQIAVDLSLQTCRKVPEQGQELLNTGTVHV